MSDDENSKPDQVAPNDVSRTTEIHTERVAGRTETQITTRQEEEPGSTPLATPLPERTHATEASVGGSPLSTDLNQVPRTEQRIIEAPPSFAARAAGLGAYNKDVRRVGGASLSSLLVGLFFVALGAWPNWIAALLWGGACSAMGWVLGFLFGIPRTLQSEGQAEQLTQTATKAPAGDTKTRVDARRTTGINTNLEQISDWLTKILVGVTLVQLGEVTATLNSGAILIAESIGGLSSKSFAYALMIYFSITGFLGSYLLTRLFLQRAFERDSED